MMGLKIRGIMMAAICALLSFTRMANAQASGLLEVERRDFLTWLLTPALQTNMLTVISIFIAGILVGAAFAYLEYHSFKASFDLLGKALLILLPLMAIGAMVATLAMHRYNLFLLSLYLDVPMIGAPVLYIIYKKLMAPKKTKICLGPGRKHL
jgi:hypothetical protein